MVNGITAEGVSSSVTWSAISLITGGSFAPFTFKTNVSSVSSSPSDTVIVIAASPD